MIIFRLLSFLSCIFFIFGCSCTGRCHKPEEQNPNDTIPFSGMDPDSLHFQKVQKIFVTGDFDGNGKQDTIFQHIFSGKYGTEMDSLPSPFECEWEEVIAWYYDQQADLRLTYRNDTLHLGIAQGFYCLINLGDLNSDKKDEIALSADWCDYSACNSCNIYSIHQGKFTLLKTFGIHESAFDFENDTRPVFKDIKGFLEKHSGKWKYLDYSEYFKDSDRETEPQMKLLKLDR